MKKLNLTLIVVFVTLGINSKAQVWQTVGNAGFTTGYVSEIPLVMVSSVPYVAFADASNGFKATVMKHENSVWSVVGTQGFTSNGVQSIDMKHDGANLHVAYIDFFKNAGIMKFDGTNWVQVGPIIPNVWYQIRLTFVNSIPYLGYLNGSNQPVVLKFDGTNWVSTGLVYSGYPSSNVIDLSTDGTNVFVAYKEASNSLLSVAKYNGTSWSNIGSAGFSMNTVSGIGPRPISLAFNGTTPYVAYTSNDVLPSSISVMKFDGSLFWVPVVGSIATSGEAYSPVLAFNESIPYLAFQDFSLSPRKVRFLKYLGSNINYWEDVVSVGISQGQAQNPSIAFDNDIPYVAYRDDANSSKGTVLRLNNIITGVQSYEESMPEIKVYPNPTKNQIYFSVQINAQLTNVAGQIIKENKNVKMLDLTDQPTGIYFLTLTNNEGQVLQRSKIIKE